mmetsp:Transcript_5180/g.15748  ORF Transcript_5180/g.15748 Transcript_5180/m.15748 type:complete len:279 (+) Transcript_5180:125-961(+)
MRRHGERNKESIRERRIPPPAAARCLVTALTVTCASGLSDTCVFLLSTPGSGSSTMVELLAEESRCEMSGENWGEFITLAAFQSQLSRTINQPRERAGPHDYWAWHKVYNDTRAMVTLTERFAREMVEAQLNPRRLPCWGFKEIRYGLPPRHLTMGHDIAFLGRQCARPRVIFHMRRYISSELNSTISEKNDFDYALQRACFRAYVRGTATSDPNFPHQLRGCVCTEPPCPPAILHELEDYIEHNARHERLWSFLGLPSPRSRAVLCQGNHCAHPPHP